MRFERNFTAAVAAVLLAAPVAVDADVITLQIPGVPGDVQSGAKLPLPADAIQVLSVGGSLTNVGSVVGGGGAGAGKPVFTDVSVVKKFGQSSPSLFLAAAQGTFFPNASIRFYRTSRSGTLDRYFTITLRDVRISSQKWGGGGSEAEPSDLESVTIEYSRITLLDEATGARACYDVARLTTC